jgi:hypothetical protein
MIDFLGVRKLCLLAFPVSRFLLEFCGQNGKRGTGNGKLKAAASCRTPNKMLTFDKAEMNIAGVAFPL